MRRLKMKLCVAALATLSAAAMAADDELAPGQGTVTFNGKLISDTCTIASDSKDIQVTLPTLSIQTLKSAGITAGSKVFNVNVENCPKEITKVAAHFEAIGSSGVDSATGNLTNQYPDGGTADPKAGNVEVILYDSNEKHLKLGDTGSGVKPGADGKATMTYYGGYYATDVTTAGKVLAKARYTLAYP